MLKNSVLKAGHWPISKSEVVNKKLKLFIRYINSMDLENLNHSKSCKWTLTRCDQKVPRLGEWKLQFIANG